MSNSDSTNDGENDGVWQFGKKDIDGHINLLHKEL